MKFTSIGTAFPTAPAFLPEKITGSEWGSWGGWGGDGKDDSEIGYSLVRDGARGRSLLHGVRQYGHELVKRLKDAEGDLDSEVRFWANLMALMAKETAGDAKWVTSPPSSGKRDYHLGTALGGYVAAGLNLPFIPLFDNPNARGNRIGGKVRKLQELSVPYELLAEVPAGRGLLVDDAYCTGTTLRRCVRTAPADWFVIVLAKS